MPSVMANRSRTCKLLLCASVNGLAARLEMNPIKTVIESHPIRLGHCGVQVAHLAHRESAKVGDIDISSAVQITALHRDCHGMGSIICLKFQ